LFILLKILKLLWNSLWPEDKFINMSEHIIFMVAENVIMTRKEYTKQIKDHRDSGHSAGCANGLGIGICIGMIIIFIVMTFANYDAYLDTSYKQEACFNAVGDYKFISDDGDQFCVVTQSPTKISLYKLVAYNGKWVVSREATVLDGITPDFYD